MAANKRPSFLKRQKEQARMARAQEKRESRRLRKQARREEVGEAPTDPEGDAHGSGPSEERYGGPEADETGLGGRS